jgi:hypothetical protein
MLLLLGIIWNIFPFWYETTFCREKSGNPGADDHNFFVIFAKFWRKIGVFLNNQCYDQIFVKKLSVV